MRSILVIVAVIMGSVQFSGALAKVDKDRQEREQMVVASKIESRDYVIYVDQALPASGPSVMLTSMYSVTIKGDSLRSYLPYFGRAYSIPYGGGEGLIFNAIVSDYKLSHGKRGVTNIDFSAKTREDRYQFSIKVYPEGSSSITVLADNRQSISFNGDMDLNIKSHSSLKATDFRTTVDGKQTDLYRLINKNGVEVFITNFGARIVEFWAPDREGNFESIVVGQATVDKYVNGPGKRFHGATIGRYANRIAKGQFTIDSVVYSVPNNNKANSLHGGTKGFDLVVWDAEQKDLQSVELHYVSKDGEMGYPGNLTVDMSYRLSDDNELIITYTAKTDKKSVINLTNHSFFNLHGGGVGPIDDHLLTINADGYTPVNNELIPLGEIAPVENTPMDFRKPALIGARLDRENEQLKFGRGYDHNWALNRKTAHEIEQAALLYEPESGRYLEVLTTQPGLQFYGGNFVAAPKNQKGIPNGSVALETQHFPDSPNQPSFPSTLLMPEQIYKHVCIYKVGAK